MKRPRLLCVDDDPGIRRFYAALFGRHGYEVVVAGSGRQALTIVQSHHQKIDAVITDYDMAEMNGPELAAALKRSKPGLPIIMISGSPAVREEAPHFVDAALDKGAPVQTILDEIERLLARHVQQTNWSQYARLGSILAAVAGTMLLLSRAWE